ncbi:pentatricopeptide repeat-containing protein, partial [Trifolium medium]|nr:pentatricopeptide repeat-containing protein [Trifolium medium]
FVTGNSESEQVVEKMMNPRGDCVTYNILIDDMSKTEDYPSPANRKATYTSRIKFLCRRNRIDEAYGVLNQMIVSGFSPSFATMNDVVRGFLRIGETTKAYNMRNEMNEHTGVSSWMYDDTQVSLYEGLSDEVTYTGLMNAYLDEGNWDNAIKLFYEMKRVPGLFYEMHCSHLLDNLPKSVIHSVFINGLDKKTRTTEIKKELLKFNYMMYELSTDRPILEYHRTLAENSSDDEFKILVELVQCFCSKSKGLDNLVDMFLNTNYKPDGIDDGIVYNLFIIIHRYFKNVDNAYNVYKEMVRSGFACHMFTVFALITTLKEKNMVNELLWVIQSILGSCNLNDSEMVKFCSEFNPKEPVTEALFEVLAEKAKDGLFLKCSYAPANA